MKVIDAHIHLLQSSNFDRETWEKGLGLPMPVDTPIEDLIRWLKNVGVVKGIVMGQDMSRIWNSTCGDDYVISIVKKHPDLFIGFASVEPLDKFNRLNKSALQHFENAITKDGLKGLLLTPPFGQYYSNDRRVYPFYELADHYGVTVQFHHSAQIVGNPSLCQIKYARMDLLHDVIVDFPHMRIVIEHMGFPWTEELLILMVSDENIYTDFAMMYDRPLLLTWNLVKAKEYGLIDRIIYGSDYWAPGQGIFSDSPDKEFVKFINFISEGINQVMSEQHWLKLTDEEIEGILWKNSTRFYELEE